MHDSLRWKIPLILVLLVAAVLELFTGTLNMGFDLKGGVELRYKVQSAISEEDLKTLTPDEIADRRTRVSVETQKTLEVIRKRLDPTGTIGPDIRSERSGEIIIRLPSLSPNEVESIKRRASEMGKLRFRMIIEEDEYKELNDEAKATVVRKTWIHRRVNVDTRELEEVTREDWVQTVDPYEIKGSYLTNVRRGFDEYGALSVNFTLNPKGANLFYDFTKYLAEKGAQRGKTQRLGIVLNDELQSAPLVQNAIPGGRAQITGDFTEEEINDLIAILQAGSLPTKLQLEFEVYVGPELGTDSRDRGYFAVQLAFVLVVVFMGVYYMVSGAIADLALAFNLVLLLAAMALTGAVMTLPGIAGIILTVGMAVDANVLIYERVREELEAGHPLRFAIRNGYARAFTTILDANLTTLITAIILYWQGTGAVRGFAVTLSIGIVVSMFTALFVTRALFDFLISRGILRERLPMMRLFSSPHLSFVRYAPLCVGLSVLLIIAGMGVFLYRGHDNYGIDFSSGTAMQLRLTSLKPKLTTSGNTMTIGFTREGPVDGSKPVEVARRTLEEGLRRLGLSDALVPAADAPDRAAEFTLTIAQTPETPDLKALTEEIEKSDVFRMSMDIKDVRARVTKAGYPTADVQTAFGDKNVVGERESDQFAIRIRGGVDILTQEQREAVLRDVEGAFKDLVDMRSVDVEAQVTPVDLPAAVGTVKGNRVKLDFVERVVADNSTRSVPLRRDIIISSIAQAGYKDVTYEWPEVERKFHYSVAFTTPVTDKAKILKDLGGSNVFTVPNAFIAVNFVGPGQASRIVIQAWTAALLSLIAIVFYIWLRFGAIKYGLAAVAALVHDVLFTLGLLAAFAWLAQTSIGEALGIGDVRLSLPIVAGILMIIGYSLNDTIVVFDRIRENVRRRMRALRGGRSGRALNPEIIDNSINQVLSRTVLTSATTLLVCITLYVVGGMTLHGMALCLIIGVAVGTYSSIFIASPILVMAHAWEVRRAEKTGRMTAEERDLAAEETEGD